MVTYVVPAVPGMVVLDAIHWIQAYIDGDLAVRWNCKAAICGSCSAEINGFPRLMCKTRIDALPKEDIWVHPLRTFPLIKDLVTDVSWNYRIKEQIPPFTPPPDVPSPWNDLPGGRRSPG
jgi:succinate dehydrogenase / fumarate reductase iron-sulfur subunit